MSPVVRISDAAFADLKAISVWIGAQTPSQTIERLVREKMDALDLERDVPLAASNDGASTNGDLMFQDTPGLSFTRVLEASVNGHVLSKPTWVALLHQVIRQVRDTGLRGQALCEALQLPAKPGLFEERGYRYDPDLGISIQGQAAPDAWREARRLAETYRVSVRVRFQWRDNEKAQYPGRVGVLTVNV